MCRIDIGSLKGKWQNGDSVTEGRGAPLFVDGDVGGHAGGEAQQDQKSGSLEQATNIGGQDVHTGFRQVKLFDKKGVKLLSTIWNLAVIVK